MHVQAVVIEDNKILMVRQYIAGKKIIWTLPGGRVEDGETYCEAIRRELIEETGYEIAIKRVILDMCDRVVYECFVLGGEMYCDFDLEDNGDILEIDWISLDDIEYNEYVNVALDRYFSNKFGRCK